MIQRYHLPSRGIIAAGRGAPRCKPRSQCQDGGADHEERMESPWNGGRVSGDSDLCCGDEIGHDLARISVNR